jgi:hypothetical protein
MIVFLSVVLFVIWFLHPLLAYWYEGRQTLFRFGYRRRPFDPRADIRRKHYGSDDD